MPGGLYLLAPYALVKLVVPMVYYSNRFSCEGSVTSNGGS